MKARRNILILGRELFEQLSSAFPLACESDEFYFFPQLSSERFRPAYWDDFSRDRVEDLVGKLKGFENLIVEPDGGDGGSEENIDRKVLQCMARTLKEQLIDISIHASQPTFHLTLLCAGIGKAISINEPDVWKSCVSGIPDFLERARECLQNVPRHFCSLGVSMTDDTIRWIETVATIHEQLAVVLPHLELFRGHLLQCNVTERFLLPPEWVSRVFSEHMCLEMELEELRQTLKQELAETEEIMRKHASRLSPGRNWREMFSAFPQPGIPDGDILSLYRSETDNLRDHCEEEGMIPFELAGFHGLEIIMLPDYMRAIRAASSYSFSPSERGGENCFYVDPAEVAPGGKGDRLVEYRMLTAHETYPGHHLLDTSRWSLAGPVRKHLEFPLFYEGWACFAEEMMRLTCYFSSPEDLFLLAKRRYWRAVRGMVDLELQARVMDLEDCARFMVDAGLSATLAPDTVIKYALRPGYQLCYTVGLRKFLHMFSAKSEGRVGPFVRKVLSAGEIGFGDLENIIENDEVGP